MQGYSLTLNTMSSGTVSMEEGVPEHGKHFSLIIVWKLEKVTWKNFETLFLEIKILSPYDLKIYQYDKLSLHICEIKESKTKFYKHTLIM